MMETKVIEALKIMEKKGYLKKVVKDGVEYYEDSDEVKGMLKDGKTREQIANLLESKYEKESD